MESAPKSPTRSARNAGPTGNDRRLGNRHKLNLAATITVEAPPTPPAKKVEPTPIAVTVTHFSVNGLAFRTETRLVEGTVYHVACFDSLLPSNLRVRVVTLRETATGSFEVGSEVV